MELILTLSFVILFCHFIRKHSWFRDPEINNLIPVFLFILKIIIGYFGSAILLSHYKGGDALSFFKISQPISRVFRIDPTGFLGFISGIGNESEFFKRHGQVSLWYIYDLFYNDNRTMIRVHSVIGLFSLGKYQVHVAIFNMLSFTGLFGVFKAVRSVTSRNPYLMLAIIFMVPGVLFWISLPSKESLLLFGLGLFISNYFQILSGKLNQYNITGMICSGSLLVFIKGYFLVLITPAMIAYAWVWLNPGKYALIKYLSVYMICFVAIELIGMGSGKFDIFKMISDKRERFENLADYKGDALGSRISLPEFKDGFTMIKASPKAIITVLTRPGIKEADNLLVTFAAAENIIIILLFAAGMIYFKKYELQKNLNLVLMLLFFSLSILALIGLTTPVMGTIVRHKSPVMPFLCLIPLLISAEYDRNRKKKNQLT